MGLVKMPCRCRQGLEGTLHGSSSAESNVSLVQIFPKMKNYTPYNRATSVGNQLLNNYRKFLLNYEICHRSRDLGGPLATPSAVTEVRGRNTPAHTHAKLIDNNGQATDVLGCSATASSEHLCDCPSSPSAHLLSRCCWLPPD